MKTATRRSTSRAPGCRLLLLLALSVVLVAGCTTAPRVGRKPIDEMPAVPAETTVTRLSDGREGFAIREPAPADTTRLQSDFDRAVALLKDGDHDGAIEILEELIVVYPELTALHVNAAMAHRQTGRPEPAEEHLKAALESVAGHPVASNEYGLLLRRAGRFAEARDIYEASLEKFPEYLPARRNLGILCELYLDDRECALRQYRFYSRARPEDEEIKIWIADLRLRAQLE